MKKLNFAPRCIQRSLQVMMTLAVLCFGVIVSHGQCVPISNTIDGHAFVDTNNDGLRSDREVGQDGVAVSVYNSLGELAGSTVTTSDGYYKVDNLTEGESYQIVFTPIGGYTDGFSGERNRSSVQYSKAPACDVSYALVRESTSCTDNPDLVLSCFVNGEVDEIPNGSTLIGLQHDFDLESNVIKYASQDETGTVWGVVWDHARAKVYSSAFVKMDAGLKDGPYAIYETDIYADPYVTRKVADVNTLSGGGLAGLSISDVTDCAYGDQVGRVGLGNLVKHGNRLYVSVLDNNTVVSFDPEQPTAGDAVVYNVPAPSVLNGADKEWKIFALASHNDKIWVGATITASESGERSDSYAVVYSLDPETSRWNEEFTTDYILGYWQDSNPSGYIHGHWLTDIDFADEKYMMLGLSDRVGHRYCKTETRHRVDQQFPDLLGVWYDVANDAWTLEDNGTLGGLTGTKRNNNQGPGGGEFFGDDYWISDSLYHHDIALGSILALPGQGEVVAAVYDPYKDAYAAGLHRYSTANGSLVGRKQLYNNNNPDQFGKATGFGDISGLCGGDGEIEIGNFVWLDANSDGMQNAGEEGLANIPLRLYDADCNQIASTLTDENGYYSFNNDNVTSGVDANTTYYVAVDGDLYDARENAYNINGKKYNACESGTDGNDFLDCDLEKRDIDCINGLVIEVRVGSTDHSFDLGFAEIIEITSEYVGTECAYDFFSLFLFGYNQGYFVDHYRITAAEDLNWEVYFSEGYFNLSEDGEDDVFIPINIGDDIYIKYAAAVENAVYDIYVYRQEGVKGKIVLKNEYDDFVTFEQGPDEFARLEIEGPAAVCTDEVTYTVANADPALNYLWVLGEVEDEILDYYSAMYWMGEAEPIGIGESVTIDWSEIDPGQYQVLVITDEFGGSGQRIYEECILPGEVLVTNGTGGGPMSCVGHINLSMDEDCSVTVTPEMIVTSEIPEDAAYAVMLIDENGEAIPSPTLTGKHVGQTVTVKVIDGCSGNSCWAEITVEDKTKPEIMVFNDDIFCNKVDGYPGPAVRDNCDQDVEIKMISSQYERFPNCSNEDYIGRYLRKYQAIDDFGNVSDIADVTVNVERVDLDEIDWPEDYTLANTNPLTCNGYETEKDGSPALSQTGVPSYKNEVIFPHNDNNAFCGIIVDYEDVRLPEVGSNNGVIKYMRTWTVYEWCTEMYSTTHTQVIEIMDVEPPVIEACAEDLTVGANTGDCEGRIALGLPTAYDECGGELSYRIDYNGVYVGDGNKTTITLPVGVHTIDYTVTDNAGLSSTCSSTVTVVDNVTPTVICKLNMTISLNDDGEAYMPAYVLDNGSYDACGIDTMLVQRMNPACGNDVAYGDRVYFCCDDVGTEQMVRLTVWDNNGNSNDCMVSITVQDKSIPQISTLKDVTIDCEDNLYPLSQFGLPTFTDPCGAVLTTDSIVDLNDCGVGTVTRVFTADDGQGSASSTQTIYIINEDPFDVDDITHLPEDYTVEGVCDDNFLHPDSLDYPYSRPEFDVDRCDRAGASFTDEIYTNEDDETCYKIVRTWKIGDWCQNDDDDDIIYTHVQFIKVFNRVAPSIVIKPIAPVSSSECTEGTISLTASATDDCTAADRLGWKARIYYDGVGLGTDTADHEYTGRDGKADASGTYPLGTHTVEWTFSDACGNTTTTTQEFTIGSNVKPVLSCYNLTVGLGAMDTDGIDGFDTEMATFNVDTLLDLGSSGSTYHPCGIPFELSLRSDTIVKTTVFDCFDIGINEVTVYAIDIYGNVAICKFTIDVQDNNDVSICREIKDCVSVQDTFEMAGGANCMVTIGNTDLDPSYISNECGTSFTFTHDVASQSDKSTLNGASFGVGTHMVTWTITNGMISTTCKQIIIVTDGVPPAFSCPSALTLPETADGVEDCQFTVSDGSRDVTAKDDCDNDISIVHNYPGTVSDTTLQGAVFTVGRHVVVWTATDASGNTSTCEQVIIITDEESPVISCTSGTIPFEDAADGTADCQYTVNTDFVVSGLDNCEGVLIATHNVATAADSTNLKGVSFPVGSTEVIFTVTDSGGNSASCTVTFLVRDTTRPTIACTSDVTVDADESCEGVATDVTATDNCSVVSLTHNIVDAPSSTTLSGYKFPIGTTPVRWIAVDPAGLRDTCSYNVTVVDRRAPECVAQDTAVVNIGVSGVYTITSADLSTPLVDNCGGAITYSFTPATLTCANAGETVIVRFTARDTSGNVSTDCELPVTINDGGEVLCNPIDITINLDENGEATITPADVNNSMSSVCGDAPSIRLSQDRFICNNVGENMVTITVNDSLMCTATVTVTDTVHGPQVMCQPERFIECDSFLTTYGGDVRAWMDADLNAFSIDDNCPMRPSNPYDTTLQYNLSSHPCGYGESSILVTVSDNHTTSSCTVLYTVMAPDDVITQDEINALTLPSPINITECVSTDSLQPNDMLGIITLDDLEELGECGKVSVMHSDSVAIDGCTRTITRTWTIVDTCQTSTTDDKAGVFTRTQVITVTDNTAPVYTGPKTFEFTGTNVNCTADVVFTGINFTDCGAVTSTNNSEHADNPNSADPSGNYPDGEYEIIITSMDDCGNTSMDTINVIVTAIGDSDFLCSKLFPNIGSNGTVTTEPTDYFQFRGSCVDEDDFLFSFNRNDPADNQLVWDCDDVDSLFTFTIYRFTMSGMVIDSCLVQNRTTDSDSICTNGLRGEVIIAGHIKDEMDNALPDFNVNLVGSNMSILSDGNGIYEFPSMARGGSYQIAPVDNDDLLDGVDVLDVVRLQRHILKLDALKGPYNLLAGDINNDRKLNAADLLTLRKAILGTIDRFPNNTSWRAIDASYEFIDTDNPLAETLPEVYTIDELGRSMIVDFTGFKVGDVDDTGELNRAGDIASRSTKTSPVTIKQSLLSDGTSKIEFISDVVGLTNGADLHLSIDGQVVDVNSDVYGSDALDFAHDGENYRVLMTDAVGVDIEQGDVLLTLTLEQSVDLATNIKVAAKSILVVGSDLEKSYLDVRYESSQEEIAVLEVSQNTPNPWTDDTQITINVPEADDVRVTVYDINGRVVYDVNNYYNAGKHTLSLDSEKVGQSGIYYYQVNYRAESMRYKMIKIN